MATADQVAELRGVLDEMKQAVTDCQARVDARLAALQSEIAAANPDLSPLVQEARDELASLNQIAAATPPSSG